jgi:hypothetical protein
MLSLSSNTIKMIERHLHSGAIILKMNKHYLVHADFFDTGYFIPSDVFNYLHTSLPLNCDMEVSKNYGIVSIYYLHTAPKINRLY